MLLLLSTSTTTLAFSADEEACEAKRRRKDETPYKGNRLNESNKGYRMMRNMGWKEGSGLGVNEQGITVPLSGYTVLSVD